VDLLVHRLDIDRDLLAALCHRYRVRELLAFGSVVREDFRPESDVDLLVEFERDADIGLLAYSRLQRELSELVGRPVDLVSKSGLKPLIRNQVLGQAQTLHAA